MQQGIWNAHASTTDKTTNMQFRHLAAACAAIPLFGCAPFHDSRPVEQQQADLRAATDALVGTYDVVDSRLNNRHFTSVVVRKTTGRYGPDVTMTNADNEAAILRGSKKCIGYVVQARSYASMMCDDPAYGVNFYSLGAVTDLDRTVKDGGVIKSFPDMAVPPGHFLLQYAEERNGRTHYLVLKKQVQQ